MSVNDPAAFLEQLAAEVADLRDRVEAMGVASLEALLTPQSVEPRLGAASAPSATSGAGDVAPAAVIAQGAVVSDSIADGAIDFAKFAAGIVPPRLSATAPTLPSANYPVGSFYFNTTDKHLYKTTDGNTWGLAVDAGDIVSNTITAGQIAAGAIGADEIAANAITAAKIAVGGAAFAGGNLVKNGSFEDGSDAVKAGWVSSATTDDTGGWTIRSATDVYWYNGSAGVKTGSRVGVIRQSSSGTGGYPGVYQSIPVVAGRRYRLSGWVWKGTSDADKAKLRIVTQDKTGAAVTYDAIALCDSNSTTPTYYEGYWTCPTDGTVSSASVEVLAYPATATANSQIQVEDVVFEPVPDYVRNSSGNVVIDSSGITISNGKLTFRDNYGQTALEGRGFGSPWVDFIRSGLFNSTFYYGSLGTLGASTIPSWTAALSSASAVLESDSSSPAGRRVNATPSAQNGYVRLTSDLVPISAGDVLSFYAWAGCVVSAPAYVRVLVEAKTYYADGTTVYSDWGGVGLDQSFGGNTAMNRLVPSSAWRLFPGEAWLQVRVTLTETTGHSSSTRMYLGGLAVRSAILSGGLDMSTSQYGSLTMQDMVIADGGMRTKYKAGTFSDADFSSDADGNFGIDGTNHRLYMREAAGWHYINRTAGFEVPAWETLCPSCRTPLLPGDDLIGQGDRSMSDGALHGLWKHARCAGFPLDAELADAYWDIGDAHREEPEGRARVARAIGLLRGLSRSAALAVPRSASRGKAKKPDAVQRVDPQAHRHAANPDWERGAE